MEGEATRLPELRTEISDMKTQRDDLQQRLEMTLSKLAEVSANLESERNHAVQNAAFSTGVGEQFTHRFEVLANEILEKKSQTFTSENQISIGHLLDPLKVRLTEFQAKVEEAQKEGIAGRSELRVHLGDLKSISERMSSGASDLVNALKGSSKTQGDWGESILELTLEACGLRKGHHYRVQESFDGEKGRGRPDVIVDLPGGRHLVIDAKVSLVDYSDYCHADDEAKREASLKRHLLSVRTHLKGLHEKNYQSLYQLKSHDFVVMFVPIEPAFMVAIDRDRKLLEDAWKKDILLVSHSTLLFALRTVKELWRQEAQVRSVQQIVDRGRELYDKLAAFAKDLADVGIRLNYARDSYDEAIKKLSTGKGNAIRQAEMLKELGVKPTKNMPPSLLEAALDDEVDDGLQEPLLLTSVASEVEYISDPAERLAMLSNRVPALASAPLSSMPNA